MVVRKRLLVLANSNKFSERCIAGREVLPLGENQYQLGGWLRPVSESSPGGELKIHESRYPCKSELKVFDFAEATLSGHAGDPCQPENWRIARILPWRNVSADYDTPRWESLPENPPHLWLEPSELKTDRISHDYLAANPPGRSLCMVKAEDFRFRLWPQDGIVPHKPRCMFRYHGIEYDLGLTDPNLLERYRSRTPELDQPPVEIRLPTGCNPLLCVSLTGEFKGYHYKVVATVLERMG